MADMTTIYSGVFTSKRNVWYRVDIQREYDGTNVGTPGELTFEAEEPLVIEWGETAKHEPVVGSTATLRIESPGDRTYIDLYTIKPGAVRMNVHRSFDQGRTWALYWSGTLDPEFYEEPYERLDKYPVSLTFSDFGILERKDFEGTGGMLSLSQIVDMCLEATGLPYDSVDTSLISTQRRAGYGASDWQTVTLGDFRVCADNFYDEEGEPSTLREVLTGILQPLGLKIMQRGGKVWVYDLNGLYNTMNRSIGINWSGDRSTLSTDAVYQKVSLNYSPYVLSGNLIPEECYDGTCGDEVHRGIDTTWHDICGSGLTFSGLGTSYGNSMATKGEASYMTFLASNQDRYIQANGGPTPVGFTLWTSSQGKNATIPEGTGTHNTPVFFKIVDGYSSGKCEGVMLFFRTNGEFIEGGTSTNKPWRSELAQGPMHPDNLFRDRTASQDVLFATEPVFLPESGRVEVNLPLFADFRQNPFEEIAKETQAEEAKRCGYDHEMWQEEWKKYGHEFVVPYRLRLTRPNGTHYTTIAGWFYYAASSVKEDGEGDTKAGAGWVNANAPLWSSSDTSHNYIPTSAKGNTHELNLPYGGAMVSIEILRGWQINYYAVDGHGYQGTSSAYDMLMRYAGKYGNSNLGHVGPKLNWLMVKLPEMRYVGKYNAEVESEDVELSAEVNSDAKEELSLSLICGTRDKSTPSRGALCPPSNNYGTDLRRGRAKGTMEDLLCSTIYSQHAERHTKISGEVYIGATADLITYTEPNQGERRFMITGQVMNLIEGTAETTFVELSPDEYQVTATTDDDE